MILLRCPKFLRCLTADAPNFDRGHSHTSLPLPPAALSSLPTSARRTSHQAVRRGGRLCPPAGHSPAPLVNTLSLRSQCAHWLWQSASPVPLAPLPKGGWHGEAVTGGFLFAPHSRQGTRALPYKMLGCRAGPMCPAARQPPHPLYPSVIARPVRKLVVAIRFPVLKSTFRCTQKGSRLSARPPQRVKKTRRVCRPQAAKK